MSSADSITQILCNLKPVILHGNYLITIFNHAQCLPSLVYLFGTGEGISMVEIPSPIHFPNMIRWRWVKVDEGIPTKPLSGLHLLPNIPIFYEKI